jgi:hypothetical protein
VLECGDLGHKSFACPHIKAVHKVAGGTSASGGNRGQCAGGHETQAAEAGPSHAIDGGVDEAGFRHAMDGGVAEVGSSNAMDGGRDVAWSINYVAI